MTEQTTRRFGPFGIFITILIAAAALGFWYSTGAVHADNPAAAEDGVIATIGDMQINEADLEEANAEGFLQIQRDRHQLMEQTLEGVIRERLLEIEAAAEGVSIDELTAREVDSKITDPTDEEVDAFYEENKQRLNQPKESMTPRIREYLSGQARQTAYLDYVDTLRNKHGVVSFLEPLRIDVSAQGFPAKGPEGAPVTIIEFSDFECPYCSRVVPTLDRVTDEYGDKVRLVFRQFPLHQIHPNAQKAAEASLCANDQDRFWEMHDTMFQEQKALGLDQLKQKAVRLELDADVFNECLDSGKYASMVHADVAAGRAVGVTGTPAIFVNGRFLSGAQPFEEIARLIDDELDRLN